MSKHGVKTSCDVFGSSHDFILKNAQQFILKSVEGMETRLNMILSGSGPLKEQGVACAPQFLNISLYLVFLNVYAIITPQIEAIEVNRI